MSIKQKVKYFLIVVRPDLLYANDIEFINAFVEWMRKVYSIDVFQTVKMWTLERYRFELKSKI